GSRCQCFVTRPHVVQCSRQKGAMPHFLISGPTDPTGQGRLQDLGFAQDQHAPGSTAYEIPNGRTASSPAGGRGELEPRKVYVPRRSGAAPGSACFRPLRTAATNVSHTPDSRT